MIAAVPLVGAGAIVIDGLTDTVAPSDVAVVLGNTVQPDGTPSKRLAARLNRALDLWEKRTIEAIIVSGATGKEGVPEGDAMYRYLVQQGVPGDRIIVDNAGVDTSATAHNAAGIMAARGYDSAIVVAQYFHIPRARLAMQREGIETRTAHASFFEARDIYSTARELVAYPVYFLGLRD
ncbi:YdcF family protein [Brevundimonas poindexterae]|uniref:YdcF family protein n=1 Tax=Brevundimonas poindexterae TaxID=74325 RepID=UPI001CFD1967|nr:YdcF family protein [Brevundimonas poindexterae]